MRTKLADVLTNIDSGGRPKGGIKEGEGEIPSLGAEHLNDEGGFSFKKLKCVTREFYNSLQKGHIELNNILIVKDGATTGKVSFVSDEFPYREASINEHLFRLSINSQIAFPKYVFYYLRSSFGQKQILSDFRGATVGGISRDFINKVNFFLPPLQEQKRIAAILDKADAVRRKRRETLLLLDEFLRSVFLEMFGDPVRNEKGWEVRRIGEVSENRKDAIKCGPFGSQLLISELHEEGIPVLGIDNVEKNKFVFGKPKAITTQKYNDLKGFSVLPEDVIISRTGTVGRTCVIPNNFDYGIIGPNLLKVSLNKKIMLPIYLSCSLNYFKSMINQVKVLSPGATVAVFNTTNLKSLKIAVPPINLQSEFAQIVEKTEQQKLLLEKSLIEMENCFNSLMQKAFRGEL